MARPLTFWFDFASPYSFLSAMRVEDLATAAGVSVTWQPFLLGPIFAARGFRTSPFALDPVKGRAMWRDIERIASDRALAVRRPDPDAPFPQAAVAAARVALLALDSPRGPEFCRAVFCAQFQRGQDIASPAILADCLDRAGLAPTLASAAANAENRPRLRAATDRAAAAGIFGAPSFTFADELFWGDDRLEQALDWAQRP